MLAEVLADRGDWSQVMPGVRACLFSLEKSPLPLPLRLEPLHFEALFCVAGTVTLTRRDGSALTAGARQVLLLADASSLSAVKVGTSLEGVLVAVGRPRSARDSLEALCALLGGLSLDTEQVRRWMASRNGCAVEAQHLEPGGLCQPGLPAPERAGPLVRVEIGRAALSALSPRGKCAECPPGPGTGSGGSPGFRKDAPLYGGSPGRSPDHPSPEPHGHALRHNIQGCFPPSVRPAGPRLAAAAADGTGGRAAAGLLPQCSGGGSVSRIWQCQPVHRRLPPAVRYDAGQVPEGCLNRHNIVCFWLIHRAFHLL